MRKLLLIFLIMDYGKNGFQTYIFPRVVYSSIPSIIERNLTMSLVPNSDIRFFKKERAVGQKSLFLARRL